MAMCLKPARLMSTRTSEFCGKHDLKDESVVTGEKGALQNAFVYLYLKRNAKVDVHPDLKDTGKDPIKLDNKGCRFEPHVVMVQTGQQLEVYNSDQGVGHNTNAELAKNPKFNAIVSNDKPLLQKFQKSEAYPAPVACNVHPWMKAYLLVRDNPYMAVTGKDGSFEIANLPAGKHEFLFWHESVGNVKNLKLGSAGKTDRKGRAKLEIPVGSALDLGDVKLKPKDLGL